MISIEVRTKFKFKGSLPEDARRVKLTPRRHHGRLRGMIKEGRMHFRNREGARTALENRDVPHEMAEAMLDLAETYGSISIPEFLDNGEDEWGSHWSMSLQFKGPVEFIMNFRLERHW